MRFPHPRDWPRLLAGAVILGCRAIVALVVAALAEVAIRLVNTLILVAAAALLPVEIAWALVERIGRSGRRASAAVQKPSATSAGPAPTLGLQLAPLRRACAARTEPRELLLAVDEFLSALEDVLSQHGVALSPLSTGYPIDELAAALIRGRPPSTKGWISPDESLEGCRDLRDYLAPLETALRAIGGAPLALTTEAVLAGLAADLAVPRVPLDAMRDVHARLRQTTMDAQIQRINLRDQGSRQ